MALVKATSLSGLEVSFDGSDASDATKLLLPTLWNQSTLTYSFPDARSDFGFGYGRGETASGFDAASAALQEHLRSGLAQIAELTGLTFVEAAAGQEADATLRFALTGATSTALAYFPGTWDESGDAWFSSSLSNFDDPQLGGYGAFTVLHELGHAMGLKHAHEDAYYGALRSDRDAMKYTVMSYNSYVGSSGNSYVNRYDSYAQSYMTYDMAALQSLYGVNWQTRDTNTVYSWDERTGEAMVDGVVQSETMGNKIFESLWDGGGRDTLDLRNFDDDAMVDLRPGAGSMFSDGQTAILGGSTRADANVYVPFLPDGNTDALIEDAKSGAGADTLTGNEANNMLAGGAGDDTIIGAEGRDRLKGNFGDDTLYGGDGRDLIKGGAHHDTLYGNGASDRLIGGSGNDTLFGGGGHDILDGGAGRDILTGGAGEDVFVFNAGKGRDTITDFTIGKDMIDVDDPSAVTLVTRQGHAALKHEDGGAMILEGLSVGDIILDDILM